MNPNFPFPPLPPILTPQYWYSSEAPRPPLPQTHLQPPMIVPFMLNPNGEISWIQTPPFLVQWPSTPPIMMTPPTPTNLPPTILTPMAPANPINPMQTMLWQQVLSSYTSKSVEPMVAPIQPTETFTLPDQIAQKRRKVNTSSSKQKGLAIPNVPTDVIADILLRLPVKSLVRFRCVRKSWLSLITDHSFIRSHLNRSSSTEIIIKNPRLFLMYNLNSSVHHQEILNLDPPFNLSWTQHLRLVGSCNGLICLSTPISYGHSSIFLWNPSINEFITLPDSQLPDPGLLGFGFNPMSVDVNDYKVVKIVQNSRKPGMCSNVEVYSLRTNSWKSIGDALSPKVCFHQDNQVVVNGSVHWLAEDWMKRRTLLIASFDMANEVFREIALADCMPNRAMFITVLGGYEPSRVTCIGVLGGCISVFAHNFSGGYEVWVMKEYGVVESWTKQYVIGHFVDAGIIRRPLGFTSSGEVLFESWSGEVMRGKRYGGLISYDPKSKRFEDFGVRMCLCSQHVVTYVESLVSVVPSNVIMM